MGFQVGALQDQREEGNAGRYRSRNVQRLEAHTGLLLRAVREHARKASPRFPLLCWHLRCSSTRTCISWVSPPSVPPSACTCAQLCRLFATPCTGDPPGSSVHGIFQARILQWVAISFSRGSSPPRDGTCTAGRFFTVGFLNIMGKRIM